MNPHSSQNPSGTGQALFSRIEARKGTNHPPEVLAGWIRRYLGMPDYPAVQVAGTNGKGSVSQWIQVLLDTKNLRSGLFISPHMIDHAERIQIDHRSIPEEDFVRLHEQWKDLFDRENFTMFEIDLWIALAWFREHSLDFGIFESGLGARRDAVSALEVPYGVITNVGLDHQGLLGESLEQIAGEKSFLIRKNMQVVCSEKNPALQQVFEQRARQQQASLLLCPSYEFSYELDLPDYQKENLSTALALLGQAGYSFTPEEVSQAAARFFHPGRFHILSQDPLVLLDGAHNPQGIEALVRSVRERHLHFERVFFSVLADKKIETMLETLQSLQVPIVLVRFESGRLADIEGMARRFGLQWIDFEECMNTLLEASTLCCGSLYFIGAILKAWKEEDHE